MNFFEVVGSNISELLSQKGMSQTDLASKMGISKQVVSKIVKGQKAINSFELSSIAKILEVNLDRLILQKEPELGTQEALVMLMGAVNPNTQNELKFLSSVINEIKFLEELLDE